MADPSCHSVPPWLRHSADILGGAPLDLYRRIHRGGALLMLFGIIYVMIGVTPQPQLRLNLPAAQAFTGGPPTPLDHLWHRDLPPNRFVRVTGFAPAGPWFFQQVARDDAQQVQGAWIGLAAMRSADSPPDRSRDVRPAGRLAAVCWAADVTDAAGVARLLALPVLHGRVVQRGLPPELMEAMAQAHVFSEGEAASLLVIAVEPGALQTAMPEVAMIRRSYWNRLYLALGLSFGAVGLFLTIGTLTLRPTTDPPRHGAKVRHVFSTWGVLLLAAMVFGLLGQVHGLELANVDQAGRLGAILCGVSGGCLVLIGLIWLMVRAGRRDGWRLRLQREPVRLCLAGWLVVLMGIGFGVLADTRAAYLLDLEAQWRLSLPPRLQQHPHEQVAPPAPLPTGRLIPQQLDVSVENQDASGAPGP